MKINLPVALAGFSLLFGCSPSREERESADLLSGVGSGDFILYRLDGDRYPGEPNPDGAELLHGWAMLKACDIEDADDRLDLLDAFEQGQQEMRDASEYPTLDCFQPRHAIRIVRDDVTTDHLICFQCFNLMTWVDDVQVGSGSTTASPRSTFDAILSRCGNGG